MRPPRWRITAVANGFHGAFSHSAGPMSYRPLSTTSPFYSRSHSHSHEPATAHLSPRWLSDLKSRIGRCLQFGCSSEQVHEAGLILKELTTSWRELVAGSEGFLTDESRRETFRQNVVWGEQDAMGHVNNVMYVRYAESARILWFQNFANRIDRANRKQWEDLWSPRSYGLILKSIKVDYKFPMEFPDKITVFHKLRSSPDATTESFILDVIILSELHRRPAARCFEDLLVYDYKNGKKVALPPFIVENFKETFRLQEEAKEKNGKRVRELIERVGRLEKGSWDRADAKEDMGSA
ncbi:hypothetical protein NA57DRAFT_78358 [Rhizodiscina lignyota]|uniref:Thioesterase/thiol ester dehydrase-isomerase n=1 Tax=Rhizodiscina lignyota TaxID=1504668 RepID=A0A9P4ICJ0_9PEZI|nr:hypothetical protein NA57DRAFT_78358 [Rhizodiscina lignyota]